MFVFALIALTVLLYLIFTTIKPPNYPPGPSWLPIVGNTFFLKKISEKCGGQYLALLKLSKEYNSNIIGLKLGSERYVVVFGRKLVQETFTRSEFQGRPDGFFIRLRTMGTKRGITMTDGVVWKEQRSFAEKNLKHLGFNKSFLSDLIQKELTGLFEEIDKQKRDDIYLNSVISPSFLNILWTIVGGKEYLKNDDQLPELLQLLRQRSKAFDMAGGLLNQIPWIRHVAPKYSGYHMIEQLNRKLFSVIQGIINEHKKTLSADQTRDFIDAYLQEMASRSKDTTTFSDEQLIAACLDFFIAGALTTSNTLDFAILTVLQHPEVKKKLYESLDAVLSPTSIPSIDDRDRLPYVEAVLLESQRLQHVVPTAGPRRVLKDTTLGGYSIPKNSIVLLSLRSVHHDSERWPQPHLFQPERFLDADGNPIIDEGLSFFGLGKRRCPGELLAKNYLFLSFVSLFHRYDITLSSNNQNSSSTNKKQAGILLSTEPYNVTLRRRHATTTTAIAAPLATACNSELFSSTISNGHLPRNENQ